MRISPHKKIAVNGDFFEKMIILSVENYVDYSEMILWLALTRATLISTWPSLRTVIFFNVSMPSHGQHSFLLYPFKSPYFRRISSPIFAGNSQNILKKAFFRGFTCMFTVCSYLKIPLEPFWLYHIEHLIRHPSFLKRSRAQQTVGKKSHNKEPLQTHQCNPNRK